MYNMDMVKKILEKIKTYLKKLKNLSAQKKWGALWLVLKYAAFLFLALCIFILGLFFYYTYDLPQPEQFTQTPFIQSTKIYDRTGKVLLYDIYGEQKREVVAFDNPAGS